MPFLKAIKINLQEDRFTLKEKKKKKNLEAIFNSFLSPFSPHYIYYRSHRFSL